MQYLLGLDNGNTVTKAAIFDEKGREIAVASQEVHSQYPHNHHVERDMHELWLQSSKAIQQVIKLANIDSQDIKAIGCSGHGNGLYLLDKQNKPLKAIQSLDSRAAAMVEDWKLQGLHQKIYPQNLQGIWAAQSGMLLAWLKHHQRTVFDDIGSVLMAVGYVFLICLICQKRLLNAITHHLAHVGRMAFSNYISQSLGSNRLCKIKNK